MYLAIDIQMLILVVKLYVFSDYILRKRVPKSQNFNRSHFSLSFHKKKRNYFFLYLSGFLKHCDQKQISLPFWSPWKFVKIARLCGDTIYASTYVLDGPKYWYKSLRLLERQEYLRNIYFPNKYRDGVLTLV